MGTITYLAPVASSDVSLDKLMGEALDAHITEAVVIGWDKAGLLYVASAIDDVAKSVLILELAKAALIRGCYHEE